MKPQPPLESWIENFLTDLKNANRSPHTCRAYASDLYRLAAFCDGTPRSISVDNLRDFLDTFSHLKPATRARKQAALNSFFQWAFRQNLIAANPMAKIASVKRETPQVRALERTDVEKILAIIPAKQIRDQLLLCLIFETGLRVGEALQLYVEDLDMTLDDEHLYVRGKGGQRRTVLLDDSRLVAQLRSYLKQTGYKHGPILLAKSNWCQNGKS